MKFRKLRDQYNQKIDKLTDKHAVEIILLIIKSFQKLKDVQPKIGSIDFGMGGWSFNGLARGWDFELDGPIETKGDFKDYIIYHIQPEPNTEWVVSYFINQSCIDLYWLCHYFVAENGLNYSSCIDILDENGITFIREDNPRTPMGHEPKADLLKSFFYKELLRKNINTTIMPPLH